MAAKLSKAEQSERTRRALLTAARELFTERGYANTSTEDIVQRAGVTRGALYYQFRDKATLFQVIFEEVVNSLMRTIVDRMQAARGDTWQRLVHGGCSAFIDAIVDSEVQRILYVDGPAVLDQHVMRNRTPGMRVIQDGLETLATEGYIEEQPFEALARLIWGAFTEAGVYIAHTEDTEAAQNEMIRGLEILLSGLRITPPPPQRTAARNP